MTGVHNFWGRVLIVIGLCAIGFLFPLTFILAATVAYSIYSDVRDLRDGKTTIAPPVIVPFYDRDSDFTWQERSDFRTESVAEQAFLKAMIDAFDLKPAGDDLAGGDIRFAFQREILRYRVDFILNDWLIIEIDGAEWHSSPEAMARDGIRDAALNELNYSILRIPAKIVFRTPAAAVGRVMDALKNPTMPITVMERDRRAKAEMPKVAVGAMVLNAAKLVGATIDTFDAFVNEAQRRSKVTAALALANSAFTTEQALVENAVASAKRHFGRERELAVDPALRKLYDDNYKELEELIGGLGDTKPEHIKITYCVPAATGDAEMDATIRSHYDALLVERSGYLDTISSALKDARMSRKVISELMETSFNTATELARRTGDNIYQIVLDGMTLKNR